MYNIYTGFYFLRGFLKIIILLTKKMHMLFWLHNYKYIFGKSVYMSALLIL